MQQENEAAPRLPEGSPASSGRQATGRQSEDSSATPYFQGHRILLMFVALCETIGALDIGKKLREDFQASKQLVTLIHGCTW
eukprot:6088917-Amphidinium_carterae.1